MTREELPGTVAARLQIRRTYNSSYTLSWDGLLDLAVDAYWTRRRTNVQPVVTPTAGEAGKGHHRLGDIA